MNVGVSMVEFISASTAGVVNVQLGFAPDATILIQNHGGTNPNIWIWANNSEFSGWAAALGLLLTGSTGVVTRDTASLTVFAGGTTLSAVETANSAPKHIDLEGAFAATVGGTAISTTNLYVTKEGVAIPADHQTNSGRNFLIAFRRNQ